MDKKRIEAAVTEILLAVGENPDREGLKETPKRVAKMYEEIFSGLHDDPARHLKIFHEPEQHNELVIVRDIPLYSVCEHHCCRLSARLISPTYRKREILSVYPNLPGS